jgi:cytochrome c-type biogenesis protein CcmH/NrfG
MEQSELNLRAGVALAPFNPAGYILLGEFYRQKGDLDRAENAFKRALSISAFDNSGHLALGKLYGQGGRSALRD